MQNQITFVKLFEKISIPDHYKQSSINIADFCKSSVYDNESTLPHYLKNKKDLTESYQYIEYQLNCVLKLLTGQLNQIHNVDYSYDFWSFILKGWCFFYINRFYDNYFLFESVQKKYDDSWTAYLLNPTCFYTPKSASEMIISNLTTSHFDFQLLSQIISYKIKNKDFKTVDFYHENKSLKRYRRLKHFIYWVVFSLFFRNVKSSVVFIYSFINRWDLIKVIIKSRFKAIFFSTYHLQHNLDINGIDFKMRDQLKPLKSKDGDAFTDCLLASLDVNFPKIFLENFKNAMQLVNTKFPRSPKKIVTSSGIYLCDLSMVWAAVQKNNQVPLFFLQHGGGYNTFDSILFKNLELLPCTQFFSWGWTLRKNHPFSTKVSTFYIIKSPKINRRIPKTKVLFVSTCPPKRSFVIGHFNYLNLLDYFNSQVELVKRLHSLFQHSFVFRSYTYDYGWKIPLFYRQTVPQLQIESAANIRLHKSLNKAKLVIIDHCMTTMLETLSENIPTVLFWSTSMHDHIIDEAQHFFDQLKEAQLLFHDIDELMEVLVDINKDINAWWFNKARQLAVKSFCKQFAHKSNNLSNDLFKTFISF